MNYWYILFFFFFFLSHKVIWKERSNTAHKQQQLFKSKCVVSRKHLTTVQSNDVVGKAMQVECRWLRKWFFQHRLWRRSCWCIAIPSLCIQEEQHCLRSHWHRRRLRHIYHIWFLVLSIRSNPSGVLVVGSAVIFRRQGRILVFHNLLGDGISNRTTVLHKRIHRQVLGWCIRCGRLVLYRRYRILGRHLFHNVWRGNVLHILVCRI